MRIAVVVVGTIAILLGVVLAWVPMLAGGGGVATTTSPVVVQVPAGIGPVPVHIEWSSLSADSEIQIASCPAGTQPPSPACPRFNLVGSTNSTVGSDDANVPAGMQVVAIVTGPTGAYSSVTVSAADPAVGVVVIVAGGAVVGIGVWLKGRPLKPDEEAPSGQRLASERSSGAPSVVPRDAGRR